MAMGRNIRVSGRYKRDQDYSLLVEMRGQEQSLLVFPNNRVQTITSGELGDLRGEYDHLCDGYALLGNLTVPLDGGQLHFLVLATQCTSVGKLRQSEIYKIGSVKCLSLRGQTQDSERSLVTEVARLLASGTAYFAWGRGAGCGEELSLTAQRLGEAGEGCSQGGSQFWCNKLLHLPYIRSGVSAETWLVRVMLGSVEVRTVYSGATQIRAALISRLSCNRLGTRYNTRGVDDDGHVANFVETEQLLMTDSHVASHVQVRGSVPLFWEQPGVNVGSHKVKMSRGADLTTPAFNRHFANLIKEYKDVIIVNLLGINLVGSKEGEAALSTSYQEQQKMSSFPDMRHFLWDFHAEGGAKNLDKLWNIVGVSVEQLGHYCSETKSQQGGVVRINCMDCLDRSNVTQAWLGARMMTRQLQSLVPDVKEMTAGRLADLLTQMWVSNGNQLSKLYAGTGALSQGGSKLMDGARSVSRTIQNNLLDRDKQEAYDVLVQGHTRRPDFRDRAGLVLPRSLAQAPPALQKTICEKWTEFCCHKPLRVAVGNYNINGGKHFRSVAYKDMSLDDWLLYHKQDLVMVNNDTPPVDIFAVGFEEMVDLDTKNIMNASGENARLWCTELLNTLNKEAGGYSLVAYTQLVGVCLYVFVRSSLAARVREVMVDQVKTGLGGTTGNKGTVGISLSLGASSLCFLCSHFAAGQSQVAERNNDYSEAVKKISFSNGRTPLSHDYVFWCGDFNYRINMEREEVINLVNKKMYSDLMTADQLVLEQSAGNVFHGFREGAISFAPTYKYDLFSDDYDTSEKCRVPAYTDRILFTRRRPAGPLARDWRDGDIVTYTRAELKVSDHRPVLAVFEVQAREVDTEARARVIRETVAGVMTWDGMLVAIPDRDMVYTKEVVESVERAMGQFGQVLDISPGRGGLMVQMDSVKLRGATSICVNGANWSVRPPGSADGHKVMMEEAALFGGSDSDISVPPSVSPGERRPPPARPSAPPARPAPPAPRPSRPAPSIPSLAGLSLASPGHHSEDEEGFVTLQPPPLANLDWPEEPPEVQLAPLTWPEVSPGPESRASSQPPALPPPSPPCLDEPPPFSPPVLSSEPPRLPPPTCPPRVPARPQGRVPPPIPKR